MVGVRVDVGVGVLVAVASAGRVGVRVGKGARADAAQADRIIATNKMSKGFIISLLRPVYKRTCHNPIKCDGAILPPMNSSSSATRHSEDRRFHRPINRQVKYICTRIGKLRSSCGRAGSSYNGS